MKRVSPSTRVPSGGAERSAIATPSSVAAAAAAKRPNSCRGTTHGSQGRDASLSLPPGSLAEVGTHDGTMEETQASLMLTDEEMRQSAERQSKRHRQLYTREQRQRAFLLEEEAHDMERIVALHAAYAAIAATCTSLQAVRAATRQRESTQSQQWSFQLFTDAVCDVVERERTSRRAVQHAEAAVRATLSQLQVAAVQSLELHEGVFRLLHAEQIRRAFLIREEARGVEALHIPRFIALPCVTSTAAGCTPPSIRGIRDVDKLDLMSEQRCPFLCAADCPYMPCRTRHLGRLWADASGEATRRGRGIAAGAGELQQPAPRGGVTEVGRQRVRHAMAQEHYRETPNFLPSLHV